jgi:urease accessory protein
VHASCHVVVDAVAGGRTRFVSVAGTGALTPRRTGPSRVHLVAAAAGLLEGDDLELTIGVGKGARLEVCSAAASIVLAGSSHLTIRAEVDEGGELVLTPGAVLITRRGRHCSRIEIDVADGGRLLAREVLILGRSGEAAGTGSFRTRLDVGGRPAVRQTVAIDPTPGTTGSAVLAGARAVGSLLVAGMPEVPAGTRGPRAAWLPSAVPGCAVFTVTDPDPLTARHCLDAATLEAATLDVTKSSEMATTA